jgi:hypothetical protein
MGMGQFKNGRQQPITQYAGSWAATVSSTVVQRVTHPHKEQRREKMERDRERRRRFDE